MGSVLVLLASVNLACRTSMEIGVRVEMEERETGTRRHCASAYLTFVALDDQGRPTPVPALLPETPEELARQAAAERRRAVRLAHRSPS